MMENKLWFVLISACFISFWSNSINKNKDISIAGFDADSFIGSRVEGTPFATAEAGGEYPVVEKERHLELFINKRYLNIPLMRDSKNAVYRNMDIMINGGLLGRFRVPLDSARGDYYGFIDLSRHQGKALTIKVDMFYRELNEITLDDKIRGASDLYHEKYRPQLHFTAKRGWINDPNGLIYYEGEYHMYYQHNPLGIQWGNMSWGHAVSEDLVHWEEQPVVLFPNPETGDCFSGAAFIDGKNQLGLKTGDEEVIMAFYLRTKTGLCLAYSNDRGQTMTDYEGNPVLTHPGERIDTPRPLWFEPTKRWITTTYDFFRNKDGKMLRCVGIYSSENLKEWKYESRVEQDSWGDELCGCVDFFQLPLDGNPKDKKWIMVLIDGSYIVGTFNGHTFYTLSGKPATTNDRITSLIESPKNFYATMTWDNMPDGRRVQITWMKGPPDHKEMPFNQQMTLPSELTLHSTKEGPRIHMNPVREIEVLRKKTYKWDNIVLNKTDNPLTVLDGEFYEIEVEFSPGRESQTIFTLRDVKVIYDAEKEEITCNEIYSRLKPHNGKVRLRIFVDRTSVEVYANNGVAYLPLVYMMCSENKNYSATATGGEVKVKTLQVHELSSIWSGK